MPTCRSSHCLAASRTIARSSTGAQSCRCLARRSHHSECMNTAHNALQLKQSPCTPGRATHLRSTKRSTHRPTAVLRRTPSTRSSWRRCGCLSMPFRDTKPARVYHVQMIGQCCSSWQGETWQVLCMSAGRPGGHQGQAGRLPEGERRAVRVLNNHQVWKVPPPCTSVVRGLSEGICLLRRWAPGSKKMDAG